MPAPAIAAVATAATAAAMEFLRQRNQSAGTGGGPQVGKLVIGGTALRASTANLIGGGSNVINMLATSTGGGVPSPAGTAGIPAAVARILAGGSAAGASPGAAIGGAAARVNLAGAGARNAALLGLTGMRKRYRRMDHCNIKALRRAGRRLEGFVKLAKSMVQLHTRARIKKPRRRR